MSVDNRDYMRNNGPTGKSGGPSTWSVITWLIVVNVAIYFIQIFSGTYSGLSNFMALTYERLFSWQAYTLVSYQFSHGDLLHLAGNMLGIYFVGKLLLQSVHPRHILPLYFLGGIVGGLAQIAFNIITRTDGIIVGASASLMAILFATIALNPNREIRFLFMFFVPVRMTLKQIGLLVLIINFVTLLSQQFIGIRPGSAAVGVIAHFGGAAMGWIYMKTLFQTVEARGNREKKVAKQKKKFGIRVIRDAKATPVDDSKTDTKRKSKQKKTYVNTDVDAILDKISAEGIHSLTPEEKKMLEKSSEKLSKKVDGK